MTDRNPSTPPEISEPSQSTDSAAATGSTPAASGSIDESLAIDVLHVEPDPRSAELLATFAAHFADRISVRSVAGTAAALAAVDDADCVVTEQRLLDGSGVELVERLRCDGEGLPIVFHTTCREEEIQTRAFDAGADAYFEKRSAQGQFERIFDRVRALVAERDSRRSGPAEPASVDDSSAVSEPVRSEE